jgi:hypothetical protein
MMVFQQPTFAARSRIRRICSSENCTFEVPGNQPEGSLPADDVRASWPIKQNPAAPAKFGSD